MATIHKLPCPACQKNSTVAPGLLTARYQRVRCPYCFYEWHANKAMLVISESSPMPSPARPPRGKDSRDSTSDSMEATSDKMDKAMVRNMEKNMAKNMEKNQRAAAANLGRNMPPNMASPPQPFAINVSGTIKGKMSDDDQHDQPSDNNQNNNQIDMTEDDDMLALDLSRMNDTDYQQHQANQDRLKKFKRKVKSQSPYPDPERRVDWFTVIGLLLGVTVASFLLLVLLIIFRDPITRYVPSADEFYNWLSYFMSRLLTKIGSL